MYCGPVLFIDGDPTRPFLTFNLVASPGRTPGTMQLAVNNADGDPDGADPRPASQLIRPDGKQPPAHVQLKPPRPPPAVGDVLTTTSTLRTPLTPAPQPPGWSAWPSGVRLVEYGFVDSYGWGDRARTAPSGYRLLAFAADPLAGEYGDQAPDLSVRIDGVERGPLTSTSDYLVTAVPAHAKSGGPGAHRQRPEAVVSLLTGQPDQANPAITVRQHTSQKLACHQAGPGPAQDRRRHRCSWPAR